MNSALAVIAGLAGLSCAVLPPASSEAANPDAERVMLTRAPDQPFDGKECRALGSFRVATTTGSGTIDDRLHQAWSRARSKVAGLGGTHVDCRPALCSLVADCEAWQQCSGYDCARKEGILKAATASQIKCPADAVRITEYRFVSDLTDGWKATCNGGRVFDCLGLFYRADVASCSPDGGK